MIHKQFEQYHLILASKSPRRSFLLKGLGLNFEIISSNAEEIYPDHLQPFDVALFLAQLKADNLDLPRLDPRALIIAADTIVVLDEEIIGKPANHIDAVKMLKKLSGRKHEVITGICLKSRDRQKTFFVESSVWFKELNDDEIEYYIERFQPFDKAGGYGIQEWIGYIGIIRIEGSYFNIMGLPVKELYEELISF